MTRVTRRAVPSAGGAGGRNRSSAVLKFARWTTHRFSVVASRRPSPRPSPSPCPPRLPRQLVLVASVTPSVMRAPRAVPMYVARARSLIHSQFRLSAPKRRNDEQVHIVGRYRASPLPSSIHICRSLRLTKN